jgi:hypothetical protein
VLRACAPSQARRTSRVVCAPGEGGERESACRCVCARVYVDVWMYLYVYM